jgi:hypothetical protein
VERALDLTGLAEALGEHPHLLVPGLLPSPPELQALMAEMEVRLFVRQPRTPEEVMSAAWYLHGVASSNQAFALYTPERQRRAFQISAHIFDLALDERSRGRSEQLQLGFAAEIGYRRGELDPNATAVYRRVQAHLRAAPPLLEHANTLAVEAAVALLGFDTARLFPLLAAWQQQLRGLAGDVGLDNLQGTMFGPAQRVVDGVEALLRFLTLGDRGQLEQARVAFRAVVGGEAGQGDLDARWVASHLLGFAENADAGSPWSVLPPDVPSAARQAFTLPSPVGLTLWPPQRELLTQPGPVHPLAPTARRVLLSVPTSAGKSLLAQLFAVAHLATQPGGVCYVTPLRSLGRELRRALQPRLQFLSKTLGPELPDSMPEDLAEALRALGMDPAEFAHLTNVLPSPDELPDVEVMTPERLAHLLRHNADAVLNRFRLFVFDEVQLLAEHQRGFTLETLLAFLHWRTRTTNHRLVLLSASVGNRGQLMSWLDPDGTGVLFSSPWRGPRRLHAVFTTRIRWNTPTRTSVQSPNLPWRVTYPLEGIIRLRPAEGARTRTLGFTEPVGTIAFRANRAGVQQRSPERAQSTPNYKMTAQMVTALGHAGSVLVVTSTRAIARSMALEIAGLVDEEPRALQLVDFVRERLGVDHPLVAVLAHGVAFHHAALPIDILEALEEALRDGRVHYMTCTSTLTEGVNLPVRTVVIAETRYHGQPEDAQLTGPRLVNAMGRAGRAGKESEGWVVLVRATAERADDFDLFNPAEGTWRSAHAWRARMHSPPWPRSSRPSVTRWMRCSLRRPGRWPTSSPLSGSPWSTRSDAAMTPTMPTSLAFWPPRSDTPNSTTGPGSAGSAPLKRFEAPTARCRLRGGCAGHALVPRSLPPACWTSSPTGSPLLSRTSPRGQPPTRTLGPLSSWRPRGRCACWTRPGSSWPCSPCRSGHGLGGSTPRPGPSPSRWPLPSFWPPGWLAALSQSSLPGSSTRSLTSPGGSSRWSTPSVSSSSTSSRGCSACWWSSSTAGWPSAAWTPGFAHS